MRIMIWCANVISAGGGARLLSNLLPAMARQPDIDLVRLVIAPETRFKERIDITGYSNIDIVYFNGSIQSNEGRALLQDCHVVYFFWPHGPEFVSIGLPTICTYHDTTVLDFILPFLSGSSVQHYWRAAKGWVDNVTTVVVSSQHVKSRLVEHFGPRCNDAVVIAHAIVPAATITNRTISEWLSARIPAKYILYPSNVSPHKNHANLMLAYSQFTSRRECPLVLFGYNTELLRYQAPNWPDTPFVPTLISLLKRTGLRLDEEIYPLGFVPDNDVIPLIANAYAVIMPSLSEGGGSYPVEEALKLGVPVLCSDIPVMREHLSRHSADICWFNPESTDSILHALEHLSSNYVHYKTSAMHGIHDPSETWDDVASKYIHAFRIAYLKYYGALK
ncbi:glycosyltransferase [Paenibacillus sp. UMB4589-SE434]|uniref:glycosyltransferase n=1 Tax=Paenibacillus sp. UMB4589-SE434 TaxID=3046314 RepID=UPI00254BE5BD|nr:glycosyltransferase [Paenibacillus sp. UMB4589-SE434]MDK8183037.1 glycosyltransferase [Paenibacillus sp. UMB4589-SE434]